MTQRNIEDYLFAFKKPRTSYIDLFRRKRAREQGLEFDHRFSRVFLVSDLSQVYPAGAIEDKCPLKVIKLSYTQAFGALCPRYNTGLLTYPGHVELTPEGGFCDKAVRGIGARAGDHNRVFGGHFRYFIISMTLYSFSLYPPEIYPIKPKYRMINMRLAVPAMNDNGIDASINDGFSGCKFIIIVDVEEDRIDKNVQIIPGEAGEDTGRLVFTLKGKGVEAVVAKTMTERERLMIVGTGIQVYTGAGGTVWDSVRSYSDDRLQNMSDINPCKCEEGRGCNG